MAKHILIVDDDGEVRSVLGDMLEDAGYQVSLVRDGAEMRVLLERDKSVDTIVLDSILPGEDSTKLALHAKAMNLPVVMISGSNEKMLFAAQHHLQMLGKPFGYSDLVEAVEKALTSREGGQRDLKALCA